MSMKRALGAMTLAVAILPACAEGPARTAGVTMGPAPGPAVEVEAGDNVFSPKELEVEEGQTISVEVTNKGRIPHDFAIDELNLSTGVLQPGDVATATFQVPNGDVVFVCTLHRGMEGTLTASAG
jgi:plastocyanin